MRGVVTCYDDRPYICLQIDLQIYDLSVDQLLYLHGVRRLPYEEKKMSIFFSGRAASRCSKASLYFYKV